MTATTRLEDRLLRRSWNDGLLDLFSGIGLTLMGVAWQFDLVALGPIGPALLLTLWKPVRQRLVEPRAGYAEPGARTQERMTRGLVTFLGAGVGSLLLGILLYTFRRGGGEFSASYLVAGLPAVLIAAGAAFVGLAFAVPRFFAYAVVLAVAAAATVVLELHPAPAMLAGGSFVTVSGALLLARFLHQNPIIDQSGAS